MLSKKKHHLLVITGPTATGKSSIADFIVTKYGGNIINADSKQVYREIPIITAQPNYIVKNSDNLYGYISVMDHYSVMQWFDDCGAIVDKVREKSELSLIVGGTAMYIDTLINGVSSIPAVEQELLDKWNKCYEQCSLKEFNQRLFADFGVKNDYCDKYRSSRNAAIIEQTEWSLQKWHKSGDKKYIDNIMVQIFVILPPRELIYANINERFIKMLENGLVREIENILAMKVPEHMPSMAACGILNIMGYLKNECTLEKVIAEVQKVTRNYAKRQMTWFRNQVPYCNNIFDNRKSLIQAVQCYIDDIK